MGLALYLSRVRSSEVLDVIPSPYSYRALGQCAHRTDQTRSQAARPSRTERGQTGPLPQRTVIRVERVRPYYRPVPPLDSAMRAQQANLRVWGVSLHLLQLG